LEKYDPFITVLVIPKTGRGSLASRHNAFDKDTVIWQQGFADFLG
jgi:hypothetical protein